MKNTKAKKKLTTSTFDAMMKAVYDGQGLLVQQRMENYSMQEAQRRQLNEAIESN